MFSDITFVRMKLNNTQSIFLYFTQNIYFFFIIFHCPTDNELFEFCSG